MPQIYLLRHCEYDNPRNILPGRLPVELSEEGKEHAQRLAEYFSDKQIHKIYSSAVLRCKQTAEIVSDGKIPVIFDKRILETLSSYQGYWGENWHHEGYHFFSHRDELGGEGLADLQMRMSAFWKDITRDLKENIIICSHGDPLQVLFSSMQGLPLADDNAKESEISGWLEKGWFFELMWQDGKIQKILKPATA